jgi:hypothetical protein
VEVLAVFGASLAQDTKSNASGTAMSMRFFIITAN